MDNKLPDDSDGTVLKDIFTDAFLKNNTLEHYTPSEVTAGKSETPVSKEEEEIKQRLKNLGYF